MALQTRGNKTIPAIADRSIDCLVMAEVTVQSFLLEEIDERSPGENQTGEAGSFQESEHCIHVAKSWVRWLHWKFSCHKLQVNSYRCVILS